MRKVLVISSTPRKQGNSDILADQVVEGARLAGAKEPSKYYMNVRS